MQPVRVREISGVPRGVWVVLVTAQALACAINLVAPILRLLRGSPIELGAFEVSLVLMLPTALAIRRLRREGRTYRASVDARGLLLDGRMRRSKESLRSVELAPPNAQHAAWRIRVVTRFTNTMFDCESEAEARALVNALGFTPNQRLGAFTFIRLTRRMWDFGVGAFVVAVVLAAAIFLLPLAISGWIVGVAALPAALAVTRLVAWLAGAKIEVGLDGLRLRYGAFRPVDRFVPFTSIRTLRAVGKELHFEEQGRPAERWVRPMGAEAFCAQVAEARKLATARSGAPTVTAAPGVDYRSASFPKEVLMRVVEDPTQSLASRSTAATALRNAGDLDAAERERVRIAASTTASDDLRHELEETAFPSDRPAARSRT